MSGRRQDRPALRLLAMAILVGACGAPEPAPTVDPAQSSPSPSPATTPTANPRPVPSPTPPPAHGHDDVIDLAGLAHDSRDLLYRTPGGAQPAGTPVRLRLRTFWNDVTAVQLRLFGINAGAEQLLDMTLAAENVDCYDETTPEGLACDFWEAALDNPGADNLWYRFIVSDGSATAYYADDSSALDGGLGLPTPTQIDNSYALTIYEPGFTAPTWPSGAVAYQIFPDRFRNGDPANDPQTGDPRYDDPVLALDWDTLPEGYCRRYVDAAEMCPWRFDDDPPAWSPEIEGPRGRDYMGGDLRGVIERLAYLAELGVDTIYFNPIFAAASNHRYDTRDYTRIDPYLGTQADFDELIAEADARGMRVILDGVFNHTSSDSPFFDRYGRYDEVGACESTDSPYRDWFYMTTVRGPCVGPDGPGTANYQAWFGFDTLPVLLKVPPRLLEYFLTAPDSITRRWLEAGAAGWRMDVSGDVSFPRDYWRTFREVVKATDADALTISETWQKDSALLRNIRGDRFDTTMNYRLRDAVLGLLAPQPFDAKGFPDSGQPLSASAFTARLLSVGEDYPPAAYSTLMNLLDSHDTERILWTLTSGPQTREAREFDADNVAAGKQRLRLASLIQFSVPGMPQIYYGDEVGVTGGDDPDDRRTYPWPDLGGDPDMELFAHYQALASLRELPAMVDGDLRVLYANDADGTVVLARRTGEQAVLITINSSDTAREVVVPTAGFVPNGTKFEFVYNLDGELLPVATREDGALPLVLPPFDGQVLASQAEADLAPPAPPAELRVEALGDGFVELAWQDSGEGNYIVYRSPLSGGGWVRVSDAPLTEPRYRDEGVENGRQYHYVVTALDAVGNESAYSPESEAIPRLSIDAAHLAGPAQLDHTISAVNATERICAEVTIAGRTGPAGPATSLRGQLGHGAAGSDPRSDSSWIWTEASYDGAVGDADRLCATLLPEKTGSYDVVFRLTTSNGREWSHADGVGALQVVASSDTIAPPAPTGLAVVSATPAGVELAWQPVSGDETLHGYEVSRADEVGAPYVLLGRTEETTFSDVEVVEDQPYHYRVVAYDSGWNRSPPAEVSATPAPRLVSVTFTVSVPEAGGAAVGQSVHIAGSLSRLAGELPDWDPGATPMEQDDETTWTITLEGAEGTELEYKYTLGSWEYVEKDAACGEIDNRRLVLSFEGETGMQIDDSVPNWRNVAPCGD